MGLHSTTTLKSIMPPNNLSTKSTNVISEKSSLPSTNISAPPPPPLPVNLIPSAPPLNEALLEKCPTPAVDMNAALLQSIRDGTTLKV